jgi:hypothetical protein
MVVINVFRTFIIEVIHGFIWRIKTSQSFLIIVPHGFRIRSISVHHGIQKNLYRYGKFPILLFLETKRIAIYHIVLFVEATSMPFL